MAKLGDKRTLGDGRVQQVKRVGHGLQWVTISDPNTVDSTVVGGEGSGGTYTVRQGHGVIKKEGFHREQDPIGFAFYAVYKRAPTLAERNAWGKQDEKGRWEGPKAHVIMRHLAVTPEAQKRGVKPEDYGVKDVDPGTLKGKDKEFYDSWRRVNPNASFRNTELQYLRWAQGEGNLQAFEAKNRGLIYDTTRGTGTYEDGSPRTVRVVTPQAVDWAGENKIWVSGTKRGQTYSGALSGIKMSNQQRIGDVDERTGFYTTVSKGSPKKGLIGGEVGKFFTDVLSDQLKFIIDPLGIYTPALFGQEYGEALQRGGAQMTGANLEDIQRVQGAGQQIVATAAAFIPGIGIPLSAGIRAATAASTSKTYGTSQSEAFNRAGKGFIVDAFGAGIASGFNAANAAHFAQTGRQFSGVTRITQGAIRGAAVGGVSGAINVQEGESISRSIGEGALVGGITGAAAPVISSAFNSAAGFIPGVSAESGLARGLVRGATTATEKYLAAQLSYALDESYRADVNARIASGEFDNKDEFFGREALAGGVMGIYGGFRSAASESFGETLGDLFERPKDGYFSDFGWAQTKKEDIPEIPSFKQIMYGKDEKFGIFKSGGGYQGLAEAFVEASLIGLGGAFGMGIVNPREGPVVPPLGGPARQPTQFVGGPTYGGYIQQDYAGGTGPAPAGSDVLAQIAAAGGLGSTTLTPL